MYIRRCFERKYQLDKLNVEDKCESARRAIEILKETNESMIEENMEKKYDMFNSHDKLR